MHISNIKPVLLLRRAAKAIAGLPCIAGDRQINDLLSEMMQYLHDHQVKVSEEDMTDKYLTSLNVLRDMLKATKLDYGSRVATQLIEEMQGYKLIKIKTNANTDQSQDESPLRSDD